MEDEVKKYLRDLYGDPSKVGSLGGINSLARAVRKEGKYQIPREDLKRWLSANETYTLHKPLRRKFPRNRVVVGGLNIQYDCDLSDMTRLKRYNRGYSFFLVMIDDFSKYLYSRALKTKTGKEVTAAVKEILSEMKHPPDVIRTDQGTEFLNRQFRDLLNANKVRLWVTQNEKKANIAERCLKTLKNRIYRYFTLSQTLTWVDILPQITESYNKSYHRSIGMSPSEVTEENEDRVWERLQPDRPLPEPRDFKFEIDDKVRISVLRKAFEREYDVKWTVEHFIVADQFYKEGIPKYKLKDYNNDEIAGSFYEDELQKIDVDEDTVYRVERVIRRRTVRGERQALVKWMGWGHQFNSWIPESGLQDYRG